ncbi:MAG: hypothetical protein HWN79_00245 [Candidatus Lokiarchaeota archaeon]|nr:hypothetical protein [Candidatus Lokiarchaeota archaeon]
MAWTPPSKFTVTISFLFLAIGLFLLVDIIFGHLTGILPPIAIGTFSSDEWYGIIGMTCVFLAWFLMFLGVRMKGM